MSILSILICCDTLVQNMPCPLSWNFSYQNVWDFKEAEWKILPMKCWSSRNGRRKAGDIFTNFSGCQIILQKGHHPVLRTRSTIHAKRPKCHWLWKVLLGYHHPGKKIVLYQQQFCSRVHNHLNLSCQGLKTGPETSTDINKHMGFFTF